MSKILNKFRFDIVLLNLKQKIVIILLLLIHNSCVLFAQSMTNQTDYIRLSQQFLYAAKTDSPTQTYLDSLALPDLEQLANQLNTDDKRKVFWVNIYNGFVVDILKKNPDAYKRKNAFFSDKQILIAGQKLSFDMIEHGLLRSSKNKWTMGYLGKIWVGSFEKKFRVDRLDYRIHFALNCGAKSCPPIAYYEPENIDSQLELATANFLSSQNQIDIKNKIIYLPKIFSWFRADFGGKKGIIKLLLKHKIISQDIGYQIKFKNYDWSLDLDNFKK